jgi:hypothetical protein
MRGFHQVQGFWCREDNSQIYIKGRRDAPRTPCWARCMVLLTTTSSWLFGGKDGFRTVGWIKCTAPLKGAITHAVVAGHPREPQSSPQKRCLPDGRGELELERSRVLKVQPAAAPPRCSPLSASLQMLYVCVGLCVLCKPRYFAQGKAARSQFFFHSWFLRARQRQGKR